MKEEEIIEIIKTKENWVSKDLIEAIKLYNKNKIEVTFCFIGGYECLKDGTISKTCKSLKEIQRCLSSNDVVYDENITDPMELVQSIEAEWEDMHDDGGGSGWIEY